jgi:glc operon protein GlcG
MKRISALTVIALLATMTSGLAQGTQHLPLDKAVQTGDDAKRVLSRDYISDDIAQKIVNACVDLAKAANGSVSVFVLSPDGQIAAARRLDGQNTANTETALLKAQTALRRQQSTHAAVNQFNTDEQKLIRLPQGFFLVSGGMPIIVDDVMIGVIGVGGGRGINDEQCAYQALTKVLGPQPPLPPNVGRGGAAGAGQGNGRGGRGAAQPQ